MTKPTLGAGVAIDVERLVESRLLIQANSGAGKSWAIRRLLEQTYHRVPQLVIDVEGEFHTLREKFDYVLAGQKGGDCPADTKSAAMLAIRLLELGVSAIIDIYELGVQRQRFVRLFLDALVNAPRDLWHPCLVVVDEAHLFAPEAGQSESATALIDLMTRGRKRGFCGVLATQRIAKLHKDAAAECNNKLIGRSALDIDMKRAAAELGLTAKDDMQRLRTLPAGTFFAFGPAISDAVVEVKIGSVETTHPKAGERAAAPTPPRDKVKRILAQLANLPHEADEEARTAAELREQVKQLRRELAAKPTAAPKEKRVEVPVIDKASLANLERGIARLEKQTVQADKIRDRMAQSQQTIVTELDNLRHDLARLHAAPPRTSVNQELPLELPPELAAEAQRMALQHRPKIGAPPLPPRKPPARNAEYTLALPGTDRPTPAQQRIIDTIALLERLHIEVERTTLAAWYGSHQNSKGLVNNVGMLRSAGFLDGLQLTDKARAIVNPIVIPTQDELRERIMRPLKPSQREILEALIDAYPRGLGRDELAEVLGKHPKTKGVVNNIGKLRGRQLVSAGWPLTASSVLFMGGR